MPLEEEILKGPLSEGQCLQHSRYGVGVTTLSNPSRTTIDFYEHGTKTFVTEMLEVELLSEAPPRPRGERKPRKAKVTKAKA